MHIKYLIRENPRPELILPVVEIESPFGVAESDVMYVYAKAYRTDIDTIRATMTSKQLFMLNDPHRVFGLPSDLAQELNRYRTTLAEIGRLDELISIYDDVYDGERINWGPLRSLD